MTGAPGGRGAVERRNGDYFGRPSARLENDRVWLEVLVEGGPRIVRFGPAGGPNLFAETPDAGWDTPAGRYELLGGHRLWYGPETLDPSVPDATGLSIEETADGVRLAGAREASGLRRCITVRLSAGQPTVRVEHELRNEGERPLELAPWAITQVPLGGVALAPEPPEVPGHNVVPNRLHVLWPYASWLDPRLRIGDGLVALDAPGPGAPFKIGLRSRDGAVGYLRDGILFAVRFDPLLDAPHTDLGCNLEVYCDNQTVELETFGQFGPLEPGGTVRHDERWEVHEADDAAPDSEAIRALVLGLV